MKKSLLLSTQTYPLIDVRSTDQAYLDERYHYLRSCGIEAVELDDDFEEDSPLIQKGTVNHFWDKELDELYEYFTPHKIAAQRSGIAFSQIHALFPLYIPNYEAVTDYVQMAVEKTLAVSAFLDCPAVVVHPYSCTDKVHEREINLALYRRLMPFAKQSGVKICLENMFLTFNGRPVEGSCSTADEACWYIDTLNAEAGADLFGFCLDIGHATLLRRDIKSFITTLGHRLACLHIHDNDGNFDCHIMPFTHGIGWAGKSSTDWNGFLDGLREINYQGNLSFEAAHSFQLFPKELEGDLLKLYGAIGRYFKDRITNN